MNMSQQSNPFVEWFRRSSPYIHSHRGSTFVINFGGEAVADEAFSHLIHDIAILQGLGIRLVLVHGARPQIEERLRARSAEMQIVNGLRVTDDAALTCVKEAAGALRVEIEALLSLGLTNSPMAGACIRVTSGNFITAKPFGVRDGIDYGHTGEVRRVDAQAINQQLDNGSIVLLPPLGYSPTGEVFNLSAADVASSTAIALRADKLITLVEGKGLTDPKGLLIPNLQPREVDQIISQHKPLAEELVQQLKAAVSACRNGIKRCHFIDRRLDGGLLCELFTRDGVGTLLSAEPYEETRRAHVDDISGILELIEPLEQEGVLMRRSRERLETEIEHFTLMERDGMVIACAALYPYPEEGIAELACVAVHPDYRSGGRGDALLEQVEREARALNINKLFLLSTRTGHWFLERGFSSDNLSTLPTKRREFYNYQRKAKVFLKWL